MINLFFFHPETLPSYLLFVALLVVEFILVALVFPEMIWNLRTKNDSWSSFKAGFENIVENLDHWERGWFRLIGWILPILLLLTCVVTSAFALVLPDGAVSAMAITLELVTMTYALLRGYRRASQEAPDYSQMYAYYRGESDQL